jgi:hypothetical protein
MIDEDTGEVIRTLCISDAIEWHERYGHPFKMFPKIKEAPRDLATKYIQCEACEKGKSKKASSPKQKDSRRTTQPLERIYAGFVGPMSTESIGGKKYLLNITDDNTLLLFTTGLRQKGDAGNALIEIIEVAERKLGYRV